MIISKYDASHSNMVINNNKQYAHYTLVKDSLKASFYKLKIQDFARRI